MKRQRMVSDLDSERWRRQWTGVVGSICARLIQTNKNRNIVLWFYYRNFASEKQLFYFAGTIFCLTYENPLRMAAHEFRKREEEEELIRRFEENLKKNSLSFFDIDAYEMIIDHYLETSKFKKALTAVDLAMDQFPFSTELI